MFSLELALVLAGLTILGPIAVKEQKELDLEPFFSLWLEWAEMHKDNDFPAAHGWDYSEPIHEAGWYDLEFEQWLDEIGAKPWNNFYKLCALERYLVKHKYVKRKCSWNHWIYQINKEKLF